jgi:hypothetical protein
MLCVCDSQGDRGSVSVDIPLGGGEINKLYVLMLGSKLDFIRNYQLGLVEVLNMGTPNGGY